MIRLHPVVAASLLLAGCGAESTSQADPRDIDLAVAMAHEREESARRTARAAAASDAERHSRDCGRPVVGETKG